MNSSTFWARILGLYTVILAVWSYFHLNTLLNLMESIQKQPAISMTLGLFTLFLGLAMVVNHQKWKRWPIIITLLGYWVTFKGIVLLFFPQWMQSILTYLQGKDLTYAPVPTLVICTILLFCGFFLHKSS